MPKKKRFIYVKKTRPKKEEKEPEINTEVVTTNEEIVREKDQFGISFKISIPNACCVCFSLFDGLDCVEFEDLHQICRNHFSMKLDDNELLKMAVARSKYAYRVTSHVDDRYRRHHINYVDRNINYADIDYRRICVNCFNQSINIGCEESRLKPNNSGRTLSHNCGRYNFNNTAIYFESIVCPLCAPKKTSFLDPIKLLPFLEPEIANKVAKLLSERQLKRDFPSYHCPIDGCEYTESFSSFKERKNVKQIICPDHGIFCIQCFKKIELDSKKPLEKISMVEYLKNKDGSMVHKCQGVPDDILKWQKSKKMKDCPNCGTPINKNGGCYNMTCTVCSKDFNWNRTESTLDRARALLLQPNPNLKLNIKPQTASRRRYRRRYYR